jgi:hypothetical protein
VIGYEHVKGFDKEAAQSGRWPDPGASFGVLPLVTMIKAWQQNSGPANRISHILSQMVLNYLSAMSHFS